MTTMTKNGLSAIQTGEMLVLEFDAPKTRIDPQTFETIPHRGDWSYLVRRGNQQWPYTRKIWKGKACGRIVLDDIGIGTEWYSVRTVDADDEYADRVAWIQVTTTAPPGHVNVDTRDEHALGFPGIKTNVVVNGVSGDLELVAGELTGTYESPEIDLGEDSTWWLSTQLHATYDDSSRTGEDEPLDGLDFSLMEETGDSEFAEQTEDDIVPDGMSKFANEQDDVDNIYAPSAAWKLEMAVYSISGSPGVYQLAETGRYQGRYVKFRITFERGDTTTQTISVEKMVLGYSQPAVGSLAPGDIRKYGASITAINNEVAIQAAINAAAVIRGRVFIPEGTWPVTGGFTVPSFVEVFGSGSASSIIQAHSTFAGTSVARIGAGAGSVTNARLRALAIDCNDVIGVTGVYSSEAQEWSGLEAVQVLNVRGAAYGVHFETATAQNFFLRDVAANGSIEAAPTACIFIDGCPGSNLLSALSVGGGSAAQKPADGLLVQNSNVTATVLHAENATDAIHMGVGSSGELQGIYGHSSVTNVINIDAGAPGAHFVVAKNVVRNSATVTLRDNSRDAPILNTATNIDVYANWAIVNGPISLRPNTDITSGPIDLEWPNILPATSGQLIIDEASANRRLSTAGAAIGHHLRYDGSRFVSAVIPAGDLPAHVHAAGDITSGLLTHERGGLEADVSAYAGFIRIDAGVTSNIGETGSGTVVLATSPTITTPAIAGGSRSGTISGAHTLSGLVTLSGGLDASSEQSFKVPTYIEEHTGLEGELHIEDMIDFGVVKIVYTGTLPGTRYEVEMVSV